MLSEKLPVNIRVVFGGRMEACQTFVDVNSLDPGHGAGLHDGVGHGDGVDSVHDALQNKHGAGQR